VNVDCLITSGAIHAYVPPVPELDQEFRHTSRANPKSVIFKVLLVMSSLSILSSNKTKNIITAVFTPVFTECILSLKSEDFIDFIIVINNKMTIYKAQ